MAINKLEFMPINIKKCACENMKNFFCCLIISFFVQKLHENYAKIVFSNNKNQFKVFKNKSQKFWVHSVKQIPKKAILLKLTHAFCIFLQQFQYNLRNFHINFALCN